jgi:DNA modification methylase
MSINVTGHIKKGMPDLPSIILKHTEYYKQVLPIRHDKICNCEPNHINCMTAKEWIKCQIGVWQFNYEARDIRDKNVHPATFPLSLSKRVIELFTHVGELVLDPFVGSGTTLLAARDVNRNAVGFDLQKNILICASKGLARLPYSQIQNKLQYMMMQEIYHITLSLKL